MENNICNHALEGWVILQCCFVGVKRGSDFVKHNVELAFFAPFTFTKEFCIVNDGY